jgi:hypothetical protein
MVETMEIDEGELKTHTIQARFVTDAGEEAGPPIDLPITVDVQQLELICNALLKNVSWKLVIECWKQLELFLLLG